jgi:diguanylate cyclase (GGDEF)-like protein
VNTLWRIYAVAAAITIAVYLAIPPGPWADVVYVLVGASSVVAIVVGTRMRRPANTAAWSFLAAGQVSWVCGDAATSWLNHTGTPSFPTWADLAYLISYPLLGIGIMLMIRSQRRTRDAAGFVDSAIVTAGFGLLSWAFIAGPMLEGRAGTDLGLVVSLAYPAADIVLLALILRLITGQYARSSSFVMLVAATVVSLAADTIFAAEPSGDAYSIGLDVLWLASYTLWGAAALHPDMAILTQPAPRGRTPFTPGRLAILAAAALLPSVLQVGHAILDVHVDHVTLVVGSAVMALLVMARMACDIDEIRATARQRDTLRDDLYDRATRDDVTGVANRPFLLQQITSSLERGVRDGSPSAVVDVQLDGMAAILQDLGFGHRDDVVRVVAQRVEDVVNPEDCVASLGPDELVVLVDRLVPDTDVAGLAHRLLEAVGRPVEVGGRTVTLSGAIGISVSLDGGTDADALLREARTATDAARARPGSSVEFFDGSLRREHAERLDIEAGLAHAIAHHELEVHYQPVVALGTDVLDGFEALVRWDRPGRGVLSPDEFIPVAEKSELICELDRWVLSEATQQLVAWTDADPVGAAGLTVAVNISGRHLASDSIVRDVDEVLRASGLAPERLTIEVTETVLVDTPLAAKQMQALRRLGVMVSIDDFGTGYTSIGQLGSLPADVLKIDRSLVSSTLPGASELLALIVHAGHAHGFLVVAEGVEDPQQLEELRDLACDSAQGYLFARPLPAPAAHAAVAALRSR